MKKIKIMLLSLLVLGVVGGAMAFKAKFYSVLCTTPVRIVNGVHVCTAIGGGALTCPNVIGGVTTQSAQQFNAWCTTTAQLGLACGQPCVNQVVALTFD